MTNAKPLLLAASLLLAACGPREDVATDVTPAPAEGTLNSRSTVTESSSDTPTGQADVEDAETGTNSGRPDGPKDLKPGTDGNPAPSAR